MDAAPIVASSDYSIAIKCRSALLGLSTKQGISKAELGRSRVVRAPPHGRLRQNELARVRPSGALIGSRLRPRAGRLSCAWSSLAPANSLDEITTTVRRSL